MKLQRLALTSAFATSAFLLFAQAPSFAAHSFKIDNQGEHTIEAVYISGVQRGRWGRDLLGDDFIDPGESTRFTISEGCDEDILIVYTDGHRDTNGDWDTCKYDLISNY